MAEINNYLLQLLHANELSAECLPCHIEKVGSSRLFSTMDENCIKSKFVPLINSKLHEAERDRRKALHLLLALIPYCPRDVFVDQSVFWMRQCCRKNSLSVNEELVLLRSMIQNSVPHPDVKKEVISDIIPRFIKQLCQQKDAFTQTINLRLLCVKSIADLYGPACTAYRGDMNKFVMYCLRDYGQTKTILQNAADCFVSLCQCCGKGQQGINHKESWTAQFKALLNTCHKLFDDIYECVDIVKLSSDSPRENIIEPLLKLRTTFEESKQNVLTRFDDWEIKFAVISRLLRTMMTRAYPTTKSFQPTDVFELLCRVCSVNNRILEKCAASNDVVVLNNLLPQLHCYAFDILRSFILSCKRNLIPYGTLICRLCLQSLKLMEPYEPLRCKVYQTLQCWISLCGSGSCIELFDDEIIPILIEDVEVAKRTVKFNSLGEAGNERKRKHVSDDFHSNISKRTDSSPLNDATPNEKICVQAHRVSQTLLEAASTMIKLNHYENLQRTTIALLLEITNVPPSNQAPFPYSQPACRLELYKTLLALACEPHPEGRVPIALAKKIFAFGSRDHDAKISSFSSTAALQLRFLLQRGPTLAIPPTFEDESSKDNESVVFKSLVHSCEKAFTTESSQLSEIPKNSASSGLKSSFDSHSSMTKTIVSTEKKSPDDVEKSKLLSKLSSSRKNEPSQNAESSNLTTKDDSIVKTTVSTEKKFADDVEKSKLLSKLSSSRKNEPSQNTESTSSTFEVSAVGNADVIEMDVDRTDSTAENPELSAMLSDFVDTLQ